MALTYKPVSIERNAFLFCRFGVALLLWTAFILKLPGLVFVAFLIFALSAMLGISRAPMIVIYNVTFGKLQKKHTYEMLDIHDMRFIHSLAAGISFFILLLFLFGKDSTGFIVLFIFAILKSFSAMGYCPASKLRKCALGSSGGCCSISKIINVKNK